MLMLVLKMLFVILIAYLIGSIPTGYLIVKKFKGIDIRKTGSGSTGATNVKRIMGTKWFFTVMILDALKGVLAVILAVKYFNFVSCLGLSPVLSAIAVIIGHSKSIFLGFTGGKSVASGVGTILALSWQVGLLVAAIWSVFTYFSKYVSVGSIVALLVSPILMFFYHKPYAYIGYCLLGAIYIVYLHRENIKRLIKGEENKVRE